MRETWRKRKRDIFYPIPTDTCTAIISNTPIDIYFSCFVLVFTYIQYVTVTCFLGEHAYIHLTFSKPYSKITFEH